MNDLEGLVEFEKINRNSAVISAMNALFSKAVNLISNPGLGATDACARSSKPFLHDGAQYLLYLQHVRRSSAVSKVDLWAFLLSGPGHIEVIEIMLNTIRDQYGFQPDLTILGENTHACVWAAEVGQGPSAVISSIDPSEVYIEAHSEAKLGVIRRGVSSRGFNAIVKLFK